MEAPQIGPAKSASMTFSVSIDFAFSTAFFSAWIAVYDVSDG